MVSMDATWGMFLADGHLGVMHLAGVRVHLVAVLAEGGDDDREVRVA